MRFFKRKKQPVLVERKPNEITLLVNAALHKIGARIAAGLSRKEQTMTVRQKKMAIATFCLVMSAISINSLYQGLFVKHVLPPSYLKISPITLPASPHLPDSILNRAHRNPTVPFVDTSVTLDSITK